MLARAAQSLPALGAQLAVQDALDRDGALELVVVPLVDLAHAATAEEAHDPIAPDLFRHHGIRL